MFKQKSSDKWAEKTAFAKGEIVRGQGMPAGAEPVEQRRCVVSCGWEGDEGSLGRNLYAGRVHQDFKHESNASKRMFGM